MTVTPICGPGAPRLRIEQERFVPLASTAPAALWSVPVCARYGRGAETGHLCTFLSEKSKEVTIPDLEACPTWVAPNEGGVGYYVSRYPAEALGQLALRDKAKFTIEERSALLRDVGLLITSGSISLGAALSLAPDAVRSGDNTMLGSMQSILRNVREADLSGPLALEYQRFVRKTFAAPARAAGFVPRPGEDPGATGMRAFLLSFAGVKGEDPELLKTGERLADGWLVDHASVAPDVVGAVLALAAHGNQAALFDRLARLARTTGDRSERSRLLRALGQFTDPALAARARAFVLSPDLEVSATLSIVYEQLGGRATREDAYAFIEAHLDELLKRSSGFDRPFLFEIPDVFCDAGHRARAEALFGPRARTIDGATRRLANALESISLCEASRKAAAPSLEAFLKKY